MDKENREMATERGEVSPGGTEGGRRPTGVPPWEGWGGAVLTPGQRWTAYRKREVVLRLFRGEPLELLSRELGVQVKLDEKKWGESKVDPAYTKMQVKGIFRRGAIYCALTAPVENRLVEALVALERSQDLVVSTTGFD